MPASLLPFQQKDRLEFQSPGKKGCSSDLFVREHYDRAELDAIKNQITDIMLAIREITREISKCHKSFACASPVVCDRAKMCPNEKDCSCTECQCDKCDEAVFDINVLAPYVVVGAFCGLIVAVAIKQV